MSGWNRRYNYERNEVSSSESGLGVDHAIENGFIDKSHGGNSPENYVPHVITKMPDLTGYNSEISPQNISLYRPKRGGMKWNFEVLKKIPLQRWCAGAAICIVAATVIWSLIRTPEDHRNTTAQTAKQEQSPVHNESSPVSRNDYFRSQSVVQADSASTGFSASAGASNVSSQELPPWERQPNQFAEHAPAQSGPFGSPNHSTINAAANPGINPTMIAPVAATAESWPSYSQFAGTEMSPQNTGLMTQPDHFSYPQMQPQMGGSAPSNQESQLFGYSPAQQGAMQQNTMQQGVMMPAPSQQNLVPNQIAAGYGNATPQGLPQPMQQGLPQGMQQPQQSQQQGMTQPLYPQTGIPAHENALAFNMGAAPQYSQGQQPQQGPLPQMSQWSPTMFDNTAQNGNAQGWANQTMQNPVMPNQYMQQGQPQPQPQAGMSPQNDVQIAMQPHPTNNYNYSNVPVPTSDQSFRDQSMTGTNLSGTVNQYPINQYPSNQLQPSYR